MKRLLVLLVSVFVLVSCGMPLMPGYSMPDERAYSDGALATIAMFCADEGLVDFNLARQYVNGVGELYTIAHHNEDAMMRGAAEAHAKIDGAPDRMLVADCVALGTELPRLASRTIKESQIAARAGSGGTTRSTTYTPPVVVQPPQVPLPSGEVTFGLEEEENPSVLINTPSGQVLCSQTGPLVNCR